jgi:hypothetical protein
VQRDGGREVLVHAELMHRINRYDVSWFRPSYPRPGTKPQSNADAGPTSPSTRPTKSQIVNLECPGSTHERGDTNAPRTPGDLRRRGDDNLYIPFSNIE